MKNKFQQAMAFLVGISLCLSAYGGGYGNPEGEDLQRELARTQNELEGQKDRADDLERKLEDVTSRLDELAAREPVEVSSMQKESSDSTRFWGEIPIHGYFSASYADSSALETPGSFDQETVHVFLDYKLDEKFRFYGDFGFNNGSDFGVDGDATYGVGEVNVTEAFLDVKLADWFSFAVGKFYTPFGLWSPQEIAPTTHSIWDPLLVRWGFFMPQTTGVKLVSSCSVGEGKLNKIFFIGNGKGNRPHSLDGNNDKVVGARLELNYPLKEKSNLILGISGEYGEDDRLDDYEEKIWGADLRLDCGNFTFRAESAKSRTNANYGHDWQFVWFGQLSYHFLEHYDIYYRYDEGDDDGEIVDEGDIEISSIGLAYRPIEAVVFKAGIDFYDYELEELDSYRVVGGQVAVQF